MNEENLWRILAVSKPEAFWRRQKSRVLERISPRRAPRTLWALAPALAALALVVVLERRGRGPAQAETPPPAREWAMLERLDLLEDMDVIETLDARKAPL